MRRYAAFILAFALLATPSAAQRGMGGMGRRPGGMGGGGRRGGGENLDAALPDGGDLRKLSPAELIIDNRKKLSLDQTQLNTLATMRDKAWDAIDPILQHYDSVKKIVRQQLANRRDQRQQNQVDSTRGEGLQAMRTMQFLVDSLSARRADDVREVLEFLKEDRQHKEAVKLLNDQDLTFQEKLPRLGGRGGGRRGRGLDSPPGRDQGFDVARSSNRSLRGYRRSIDSK